MSRSAVRSVARTHPPTAPLPSEESLLPVEPPGVAEAVAAEFERLPVPDPALAEAWTARGELRGDVDDRALVFYLHPTTAPGPAWFADPLAPAQVEAVDRVTGEHLVAFPGRVWAPRYRQTTTRSFFERAEGGDLAYAHAYDDVAAAFSQFLADDAAQRLVEPGPPPPIVLAGHSQGALHLMSLVEEFFDHEELAARLVAVYPIGIGVAEHHPVLRRFAAAADPDSSGVVVCFRATLERGATPVMPGVCINPLTCSLHLPEAPASWHRPVDPGAEGSLAGVRVAARVRGDFVFVDPVVPGALDEVALPGGGLHRVELQLFARNLREDVRRRVAAWHTQRDEQASPPVVAEQRGVVVATPTVEAWPGVEGRSLRTREGWLHHVDLEHGDSLPTEEGPGDGPQAAGLPVVLLHKLGGWAAEWRDVAAPLARHRRVVAVDLPGHGASRQDAVAPWIRWPAEHAERLLDLLDHLGLDRVHLVGSSLGGVVALHAATAHADRVAGVGLVGVSLTPALSAPRTLEIDRAARASYAPGWVPLPGHRGRAATDSPTVLADLDASRARAGSWVRPAERGVGLAGVEHLLPHVSSSVLLVNGERAGYRSYEAAAQRLLSDVRVVTVPGTGAFPHMERPAHVAEVLADFLGTVDGPAR